ncbi:hypothetical protein KY321_03815 [Candidatus Woesearchaeota archaeon]|nr:hypothetical protein [Candidatus Woesearchaeota archaeon]
MSSRDIAYKRAKELRNNFRNSFGDEKKKHLAKFKLKNYTGKLTVHSNKYFELKVKELSEEIEKKKKSKSMPLLVRRVFKLGGVNREKSVSKRKSNEELLRENKRRFSGRG